MTPHTYLGEPQFGNEATPTSSGQELINGFLPERGIVAIVGNPTAGKSFLALHVASCLSTNRCLVDKSYSENLEDSELGLASSKGSILYLAGEGYDDLHYRIEALGGYLEEQGHSTTYKEIGRLPIIKMHVNSLYGIDQITPIHHKIKEKLDSLEKGGFPLSAIIFDTLTSTWSINDENGNGEIQKIISCLREYGQRFKCLIILIVHPPKSFMSKKGTVRGAGSLEAAPEVIWHLEQIGKSSRRKLTITKRRDGKHVWKSFGFDLIPYSNSAILKPLPIDNDKEAKKKVVKDNHPAQSPKISSIEIEVLQALEATIENNEKNEVDKRGIFESLLDLKTSGLLTSDLQIGKDALRQRVTRSLIKLSNLRIVKLITDATGNETYTLLKSWQETKQYIHESLYATEYVSIEELRMIRAQKLFENIKIPSI